MTPFVGHEAVPWVVRARRAGLAWRNARWLVLGLALGALTDSIVRGVVPC